MYNVERQRAEREREKERLSSFTCEAGNFEDILTERTVTHLFGNLVAPFGDESPFSCMPDVLYENRERPDRQPT